LKGFVEKFGKRGFEVVALTKPDPNNTQEKIEAYVIEHALNYTVVVTNADAYEAFGVWGIPHSALVDSSGIVRWIGNPHSLTEAKIEKILSETDAK
jgi:hypothetical protein